MVARFKMSCTDCHAVRESETSELVACPVCACPRICVEPIAFYVYAEDLCAGLVGPFLDRASAEAHVAFCAARGDADPGRIVDDREAQTLRGPDTLELTAEEDRRDDLFDLAARQYGALLRCVTGC